MAAASAFLRQELAVKTFCQLLLGSIPYRNYLSLEIQCLARHRVIEVHSDLVLVDRVDLASDHHTGTVQQRDVSAYLEQFLHQHTFHFKSGFCDIYFLLRVVLAVSVLRSQCKCEFRLRLKPFQCLFEFGQKHILSMYIVERTSRVSRLVHYLSVHSKLIFQLHHFILRYYHIIKV